jgi:shikimate dehydrogenase
VTFSFVVLGDPVSHSRSPAIHRAALAAAGIDGTYDAVRVDPDGMRSSADDIRSGALDGANITMPYKRLAFELSDAVAPDAARAGSVNTWVGEEGTIRGHSTDVVGIREAWEKRRLPSGVPVVVLGSGGAAAAALVALEGRRILISARRPAAARALAERVGVDAEVLEWGTSVPDAVVVNCTPLGMRGEALPIDNPAGIFDMAYGRGQTPAVRRGLEAGMPVVDGIDLLVAQAAASFRLWTGVEPDLEVMESAARNGSSGGGSAPNHQ